MGSINVDDYLDEKHHWIKKLVPAFCKGIDRVVGYSATTEHEVEDISRANIITSKDEDGNNYLMLDVDDDSVYIRPSSTDGHYHIIFPHKIKDDDTFSDLVTTLHNVGIIAAGNYKQLKDSGHLALRTPWVPKGKTDEMYERGDIGPKTFANENEAFVKLQEACNYLGVEFPDEVFHQLNAKLVSESVDIPDAPPVSWD